MENADDFIIADDRVVDSHFVEMTVEEPVELVEAKTTNCHASGLGENFTCSKDCKIFK